MLRKSSPTKSIMLLASVSALLVGCGGGSSSSPGSVAPVPLIGVFLDSPVEGLRYISKSHQGITNSKGEFSYLEGEQVSFYIGSSFLGSTVGATQVTPFDLQDAEPITDPSELMDALQGDPSPFTRAINILRLLQSVDDDQKPENGIRISDSAIRALINHVPDYSLSIDKFSQSSAVKGVLDYLNTNQNNAEYIDLFSAYSAVSYVYRSLGIDKLVFKRGNVASRPLQIKTDTNADGVADSVVYFQYDQDGNLIREAHDHNDDGIDEVVFTWKYFPSGNIKYRKVEDHSLTSEIHFSNPNWGSFWKMADVAERQDHPESMLTIQSDGLVRRAEYDAGRDGVLDAISIETLDEFGNVIRSEYDGNANGHAGSVLLSSYDDLGRLVSRSEYDYNNLMLFSVRIVYDDINRTETEHRYSLYTAGYGDIRKTYYDELGRITRYDIQPIKAISGSREEYSYDEDGNLVSTLHYGGTAEYHPLYITESYTYEAGLLRNYKKDNHYTLSVSTKTYDYSEAGLITLASKDDDADGIAEYQSHYLYDEFGNVSLYQGDYQADGIVDYKMSISWEPTLTPYSSDFHCNWEVGRDLVELYTMPARSCRYKP